jgi:molecular chaperone GrpE
MMRNKSTKSEKEKEKKAQMAENMDDNMKEVVDREDEESILNQTENEEPVVISKEESANNAEQSTENNSPESNLDTATSSGQADISADAAQTDDNTLQKKFDELSDKYLRIYSEFDNYRKRTLKERIELSKTASEDIIKTLLPIVDDLERALKSHEGAKTLHVHREGIQLIYNKLRNTLNQKGLEEIQALGLPLNTDFHEAITQTPAPTPELKDKIVDVIEKGYTLQGKVIRFAKVVVGS